MRNMFIQLSFLFDDASTSLHSRLCLVELPVFETRCTRLCSANYGNVKATLTIHNIFKIKGAILPTNRLKGFIYSTRAHYTPIHLYKMADSRLDLVSFRSPAIDLVSFRFPAPMCFQVIMYACGHNDKDHISCEQQKSVRGLFQRIRNLFERHEGDPSAGCRHAVSTYVERNQDCPRCLKGRLHNLGTRALVRQPTGSERALPKGPLPRDEHKIKNRRLTPYPHMASSSSPSHPHPTPRLRKRQGYTDLRAHFLNLPPPSPNPPSPSPTCPSPPSLESDTDSVISDVDSIFFPMPPGASFSHWDDPGNTPQVSTESFTCVTARKAERLAGPTDSYRHW